MANSTLDVLNSKEYIERKLSNSQIKQLDEKGFILIEPKKEIWDWIGCKVDNLVSITDDLKIKEGDNAGSEGKEEIVKKNGKTIEPGADRIGNLINKSIFMRRVATLPEIVWASYLTIKSEIKLSSVLFREPKKNAGEQQIHIDWIPRKNSDESFNSVVAFLYLNDSKAENGATKIIPHTHKLFSYPDKYVNPKLPHEKEIVIEAKSGSLLIMNALLWHKGGNNLTGEKRGIIITEYRQRNIKQLLNLKKYISKQIQEELTPKEKYLFGLREEDIFQDESSFGPGDHYRKWLDENKHF